MNGFISVDRGYELLSVRNSPRVELQSRDADLVLLIHDDSSSKTDPMSTLRFNVGAIVSVSPTRC